MLTARTCSVAVIVKSVFAIVAAVIVSRIRRKARCLLYLYLYRLSRQDCVATRSCQPLCILDHRHRVFVGPSVNVVVKIPVYVAASLSCTITRVK